MHDIHVLSDRFKPVVIEERVKSCNELLQFISCHTHLVKSDIVIDFLSVCNHVCVCVRTCVCMCMHPCRCVHASHS